MSCAGHDFRRRDLMEEVEDLDVSKVVDPVQRVGLEVLGERDTRLFPVPEVVFRMRSDGFHKANCLDLPGHHLTTIGCRNTRSGAAPKRVASPAGKGDFPAALRMEQRMGGVLHGAESSLHCIEVTLTGGWIHRVTMAVLGDKTDCFRCSLREFYGDRYLKIVLLPMQRKQLDLF